VLVEDFTEELLVEDDLLEEELEELVEELVEVEPI